MNCVWFGGDTAGPPATGTQFIYPVPSVTSSFGTNEVQNTVPISEDIAVTKMVLRIATAPGAGKSWAYTLRDDGANTAVTLTIADAATEAEWAGSVAIAALSEIALQVIGSGTPTTHANWHIEIWYSTTGNKQLIIGGDRSTVSATDTNYHNLFGSHGSSWNTDPLVWETVMPTDATITKMVVQGDASPGSGKAYDFSLLKNNATDVMALTINDTEQVDTATGSVDVAPGDTFVLKCVPVSTPTVRRFGWCITIEPDTAGELTCCFGNGADMAANNTTVYEQGLSGGGNGWTSTESNRYFQPPVGTYKKLYVKLATAPGAAASGKTRTLALRINGADTALSVTLSETATTGNNTGTSVVHSTAGQNGSVKSSATNTPTLSAGCKVGYVLAITQPAAASDGAFMAFF